MNMPAFDPNRVTVVLGPTASGKTKLALHLAARFSMEIVCMDSMQVYHEMNIGTARPTDEEIAQAPHHLFGCVSVKESMNCARYARMAAKVLGEIQARNRIPMLVGGTGLYFKTLFGGLDILPPTPPDLRKRIDQRRARFGDARIYRLLQRLDPAGAEKLHPNDRQRIQRFLEVRILTGRSILEHWENAKKTEFSQENSRPLTIGLEVPRSVLVDRIHIRTKRMIADGWIEETQQLRELGMMDRIRDVGPIGYSLIEKYLEGNFSQSELCEKISIQTRRYAKRQMTWFRKDSEITWFPFDRESGYNEANISDLIGNRMT